ncbi:MAG TPA: hypothetical protein VF017_02375 [Thermoanaerobaculia bacterium]|nr:hypothetical protein [Thermoanaerobaculia bacterium]
MSSSSAVPSRPGEHGSWRARRLALAALGSLATCALVVAIFFDHHWWPADDGSYAHIAERLLDGEVLHRDVQDIHVGAIDFVNAAALALFGRSLLALRYPLAAAALLQAAAVFLLLRRRGPWLAALGALTATAFGAIQFLNPTAHWYCQALFWGVVLVLARGEPERRGRLELVGLLVGTLFAFRQLTGVLAAMGTVTWLLAQPAPDGRRRGAPWLARGVLAVEAVGLVAYLLRATDGSGWVLFGVWALVVLGAALRDTRLDNRATARTLGRLLLGAVLPLLPLLAYHLAHGSVGFWWADVVATAASVPQLPFIRELNYARDGIQSGLAVITAAASLAEAVNGLYWLLLPLSASLVGLLLARRLRPGGSGFTSPLPTAAVFYALVSVHYQNPTYLYFSVGVSLVALLELAAGGATRIARLAPLHVAGLGVVALGWHAGQPSERDWDQLLAGNRLPVVSTAESLPRLALKIGPREAAFYPRLIEWIRRQVPPEEAIFVLPTNAELYFLSERRNPTRFYNLVFGVRDEAEALALIEGLRREPPRLILWNAADKYNTPLAQQVVGAVADGYEDLGRAGPFRVLRRLPASSGRTLEPPPPPDPLPRW